jgi:Predicted transcriptional regulators
MTIAEVSKQYSLTPDTLRYYERIGLIPKIARTDSGLRDYSEADCRWVGFAKCMRNAGVQINALVKYVSLFHEGRSTHDERKQILINQRAALLEKMNKMQESIDRLNQKIERYEQLVLPVEEHLQERKN